ncbi:DHA2 family multidrug resistance protein-like MFS transporter [Haloactinopolyspora alba]|uniref:DHA2 family multidrug resistance protein-like MFS transporter n=1 Tax=Haloactinopolyspora alba TaxID=648780 RepID=A0A2P8E230_9ACTN|nr:MFS transporter [Haloactinopolyspora alba]PSL03538.1 DHA2 family multidrug resistance protein-like MFS transporter [Haloactinopolyspora alba]
MTMTTTVRDRERAGPKEWAALVVLLLPVLLISVDMTVLSFAVPHLTEDLAPSGTQLLWIVDVYGFLIAGLLVTMGTLGDRIGRRRLLLAGAAAFGVASALAAYASDPAVLIAARALLGIAGATLMPSTLSLIRNIFLDIRQRTLAIAIWATMFSVGSAAGPLVGGWMLEHFWWGSVFLVNLPVMALLLVLAPLVVPESRDPDPGRYDLASAGLSLVAMLLAIYGIKNLVTDGFAPVATVTLVAGVFVGAVFVRRQRRLPVPLLDLRLFGNPAFSASIITNLLTTFAIVGALFFVTQYLQLVLGMSPLSAGLLLVPGLALAVVSGLTAVPLMRRVRAAWLVFVSLLTVAVGYSLMTLVDDGSGSTVVLLAFLLVGGGVGLVQTITNNLIMNTVDPTKAGAAAAVSETAYEVGGGTGVAILGSVLSAVYAGGLTAVDGIGGDAMEHARETIGGAMSVAERTGGEAGTSLQTAAGAAFTDAVHVTSVIGAVVVALAAVQVFVVLRRTPSK